MLQIYVVLQNQDLNNEDDQCERLPMPETEILWYMSQSKKHRHLLKHPVITSFLWMKWQRISGPYSKNLLFYFLLVGLLTTYIFLVYGGKTLSQDGVQEEDCPNENAKTFSNISDEISSGSSSGSSPTYFHVLWYLNVAFLLILTIKEMLQFLIAPKRYFFSTENWLEVILIALVSGLLFLGSAQYGCYVEAKRHMAAICIVLSWSILITMIGRHPKLSTLNIYVTMFYKVLTTFILFLAWYV